MMSLMRYVMSIKQYSRIDGDGMGGDYAHIVKIGDGFPQVITPSEPKFYDDAWYNRVAEDSTHYDEIAEKEANKCIDSRLSKNSL